MDGLVGMGCPQSLEAGAYKYHLHVGSRCQERNLSVIFQANLRNGNRFPSTSTGTAVPLKVQNSRHYEYDSYHDDDDDDADDGGDAGDDGCNGLILFSMVQPGVEPDQTDGHCNIRIWVPDNIVCPRTAV